MDTRTERIRALNDRLRTTGEGGNVVITRGLAALDAEILRKIMAAVQCFDQFTADNDPYGEHDCAVTDVAGERVMFKIDCYDRALQGHSPDESDPNVTTRVLTIMLASEY
jgi:Protein of unknown function (DUF3768)